MDNILKSLKHKKIICVGDLILDRFVYGEVSRISPEAIVPVLNMTHQTEMPGGIGNVAYNLSDLGCSVIIYSVLGDDDNAGILRKLFAQKNNIDTRFITDDSRPTTIKERVVSKTQHIVRIDHEKTHAISQHVENRILEDFALSLAGCHAVILSDYNKGVLTDTLIHAVIARSRKHDIPVFVDPKGKDFKRYRGAYTLTPNVKALMAASRHVDLVTAAWSTIRDTGIQSLVVTMAEEGVMVFDADGLPPPVHHKASARSVKDVSGAGDTFIAALAAAVSTGSPLAEAAFFANQVAGLTVEKQGTTTVFYTELENHFAVLPHQQHKTFAPIVNRETATTIVTRWKAAGLVVGFTNGCFDILHQGHVIYLDKARQHCDKLVLGLNVDASIARLKGSGRPVNTFDARANVIAALESVDLVVPFADDLLENDTPLQLIAALMPDMLFKGADYTVDTVVGADILEQNGGQVILIELTDGYSTTDTIKKMSTA